MVEDRPILARAFVLSHRMVVQAQCLFLEPDHSRIRILNMARFEVAVTRRTESATGLPIARRHVFGGFGAVLASIAAVLVAVVVIVVALVLGYLIAGLVIAALLVAILVALFRSAFRALRIANRSS